MVTFKGLEEAANWLIDVISFLSNFEAGVQGDSGVVKRSGMVLVVRRMKLKR